MKNIFWNVTPCGRGQSISQLYATIEKLRIKKVKLYFLGCFLLGILIDSEDGGSTYFRNVGGLLRDYTASYLRIYFSSQTHFGVQL
jgi:hypothetical protein